jgi:regulatory protein
VAFSARPGRRKVDEHRVGDPAAVRATAIGLLGRREYARGELAATLQRKGFEPRLIAEAMSELAGEGLLDDHRYADSLVRQQAGRGHGPARIRQALQEAGIGPELIIAALEAGPDWSQLAAEARRRKFGAAQPKSWPERARQMRFLQYRGFSTDHIRSALGGSGADDAGDAGPSPDDDS